MAGPVIEGENYRISVLTESLVRLEYSEDGVFEDGQTQVVQNRDFGPVACEVVETEAVLDKLKLNIRSLIASQEEDSKDLLDLCIDVIYHNNMKAFGLQQLIKLYLVWFNSQEAEEEES